MREAAVVAGQLRYASINRWLAIPAGAYAALVLVGSVHFGWHYAIDGYASIAAVLALWWIAGGITRPERTASPRPTAA